MNLIYLLKNLVLDETKKAFQLSHDKLQHLEFKINSDQGTQFGDISCNIAMLVAKQLGLNPRNVAVQLQSLIQSAEQQGFIASIVIAGPGFLNFTLTPAAWVMLIREMYEQGHVFFKLDKHDKKYKYLFEFVSANPTGPLHLGHGRGGIIGDVLARVLTFLGHTVFKEFYINDAGNQIKLLGQSLRARCMQQLGQTAEVPEGGYQGEYLVDLAKDCLSQQGSEVAHKSDEFFELYAKEQLLNLIKADLTSYRVSFDSWFSEKNLHDDGSIDRVLETLKKDGLVYEHEGALFFKSTAFGDDKDRVVKKSNGELTYIAADIAYHKYKFDRGYDKLIDILGHDHHGYVRRLKATMQALGYNPENLDVILYQLVTIKAGGEAVRMSKRAGNFTKLSDVIDEVGTDVARFFYLNRKCDAALDFDLDTALKKTDENPVFYIQYAYVRINSILHKATQEGFADWVLSLRSNNHEVLNHSDIMNALGEHDISIIKKIISLCDVLRSIATTYQTHLLSYYALELAQQLHGYYTKNKVIDTTNLNVSKARLLTLYLVRDALALSLDVLGLTKPEKM